MARPPKAQMAALLSSPDEIEAEFYEALQAGDVERVMALWVNDELVRCIHPGGPVLVGASAIRASYQALFASGPLAVQPAEVRRLNTERLALHQVHERLLVPDADGHLQLQWVLATNAYMQTSSGWRLVLHHASHGHAPQSPPGLSEGSSGGPVLH